MSQRMAMAMAMAIATRYARADRGGKKVILDELCATTSWYRDHARKAFAPRVDVGGGEAAASSAAAVWGPGDLVEGLDSDPHVSRLGRFAARIRGDRPGRSRGRQQSWRVLFHP